MAATVNRVGPAEPLPVETAYDLSAPFYDEWEWQRFWRGAEYPLVAEIVARYRRGKSSGLSLLDVGCGTGWYLGQLAPFCAEAVGIDVSARMLAVARYGKRGTALVQADLRRIPYPPARFDAALCMRVVSHLPSIAPAAAEIHRVMMPGGLLVVSNVDANHDYEHTRLPVGPKHVLAQTFKHSREEVETKLEECGFVSTSRALILPDGSSRQVSGRRLSRGSAPAVGWVSSWRKAKTTANLSKR